MSRSTGQANPRKSFGVWGVPLWGALFAFSFWFTLRRFERWQVDGESMLPVLHPQDFVLVDTAAFRNRDPRPGDVVLAGDPRNGRPLLKRVDSVSAADAVLLGDNRDFSTDSRDFGPVPLATIRGRVVYRYWPRPLSGRIR